MSRTRAGFGLVGCVAILLLVLFGWGLMLAAVLSGRVTG